MKLKMWPQTAALLLVFLFQQNIAHAYDYYWSGNYSAEGNFFSGVDLGNGPDGEKSYLNHHLFVRPEVVLYSGLSVKGALDIINSGSTSMPPSQRVGQILGGSLNSNTNSYSSDMSPVFLNRQLQRNRSVNINEAYLEYAHTSGKLMVGRMPLHFGFGAFYNKGHRPTDHWFTNRDGVAYAIEFGSLYFKPMFNLLTDTLDDSNGRIYEYGLEFHFKVEDTGLDLGAMILQRSVSDDANSDTDLAGVTSGSADPLFVSLFYQRKQDTYSYGFEGFFQSGGAGTDSNGNEVSLRGLGLAFEGMAKWGDWDFKTKAGYATGQPSNTSGSYSGVSFHRNYNLGLILFNHPLGDSSYDPTGTNIKGRRGGLSDADFTPSSVPDTDSISNTFYFAPTVSYTFSDTWKLDTTFVSAWLEETNVAPGGGEVSSYLGSELDLTMSYKPTQNIISRTTIGFFAPGGAFEADGSFDSSSAIGATTSLGITF